VKEGFTCSFYRKSCNPHHKALDIKGPSYETHIQSDLDWYICNITVDKQVSLPPRSLPTVELGADLAVRDTESEPHDAAYVGKLYEEDGTSLYFLV
jgi:hypothetical protein